VAFVLVMAACGGSDSAGDQADRADGVDGIEVKVTSCSATSAGGDRHLFTAKGTVENTSGELRTSVRVRVTFLDGDDPFYDDTLNDTFTFAGFAESVEEWSESVELGDQVEDLRCEATAINS
jgi:hypothetical protein